MTQQLGGQYQMQAGEGGRHREAVGSIWTRWSPPADAHHPRVTAFMDEGCQLGRIQGSAP